MKIKNITQIDDFLAAVDKCRGDVKLVSLYGDIYNLKSTLSRYVAVAALIQDKYEELEVFCDNKADEPYLLEFFEKHPEQR